MANPTSSSSVHRGRRRLAAFAAIALCVACGSEAVDDAAGASKAKACEASAAFTVNADGCNAIAPEWGDCLLPWPADVFRVGSGADARVVVPAAALPTTGPGGAAIDFLSDTPTDGFSRLPNIAVRALGGFDLSGLVGYPLATGALDPTLSAQLAHGTLILDAETGQFVPHFVEHDARGEAGDRRPMVLRPLAVLPFGRSFVVALRAGKGGLLRGDGTPHQAPATFAALRDGGGDATARCVLERDVFGPLEAAGVARDELLLAWRFTTASAALTRGELLAMRTATQAAFVAAPVAVTVTAVESPPTGKVGRRIDVVLKVPLFLDGSGPTGRIVRGADGLPALQGMVDVPATIWVPRSVLAAATSGAAQARMLQFGHGFFGSREEAGGFAVSFGDKHGFVVAAVDWWGMSVPDRGVLVERIVTNPSIAMRFVERVQQAMVNQMALAEALATTLPALKVLQRSDGTPLYDPTQLAFYGISQGHILGATYVAIAPRIERAVLAVGGIGFGLMMSRAAPFAPFLGLFDLITGRADDSFDLTLLLQTVLDRIDPATYTDLLLAPPFADGPKQRRVLMHVAVADTSVPNIASHAQARSLGLVQLGPAPRDIYGVPTVAGPIDGSAIVAWDYGLEQPDRLARPNLKENEVHNDQRGLAASMEQASRFLRPGGRVENTCDGVCDPE